MKKIWWSLLYVSLIALLAACSSQSASQSSSSSSITSYSLNQSGVQPLPTSTPMPPLSIPRQKSTPVPT
ncbi:MAG TPA: hypothetical protein VJ761_23655, partial [Ktedonobacteraceae bacterium]|nr:hypothetical protein [Ktedonobacteraceae bacterium]